MRSPTVIESPAARRVESAPDERLLIEALEVDDLFTITEPIAARQVSRVGRFARSGPAAGLIVKRYEYSVPHGICRLFSGCKPRRELQVLCALARHGNPVRPVACGEVRRWGIPWRAVLITEELAGAIDHRSLRDSVSLDADGRRRLAAALVPAARRLAEIHAHGWYLRDGTDKNLLVSWSGSGRAEVGWTDLPRAVRLAAGLTAAQRADDLAAVDKGFSRIYSRATRLRLLLAYLGRERLDGSTRELIAAIARARRGREHRTPLRRATHLWTRFFRHLPGVRWMLGLQSGDPDGRSPRRLRAEPRHR